MINGSVVNALVDSGSTDNFINPKQVERLSLTILPSRETVSMASSSLSAKMKGYCSATIVLHDQTYENVKLYVLPNLCVDVILGQNWQSNRESVTIKYGGERHPLKICNLTTLNVSPPPLFENLDPNCKPIITKSRRYSDEDRKFITEEVERLLSEGIIEPSNSPWRAQVVVTRNERHKKRLVIDFSQTINKFTYLDAYPLPNLNETVNTIAQYRVYSVIDLKSAYHQVPLQNRDKTFTAFEANGRLYQFCRIPFGVTNGVSAFQRTIDSFIAEEGLTDTFAYLDDVTICGNDQEHHDKNLKNDKIMRWRIELITYNCDIFYRCGAENIPADTFSRIRCMSLTVDKLYELHEALGHPGVTRMLHFVKSKNLPFSVDEIKSMVRACKVCSELKPQYAQTEPIYLIKATQPFERLSLDFKGPLPSTNQFKYLLVVWDEYSRFPFAFLCKNVDTQSVISNPCALFSVFGMLSYIHSDRGSSFMSSELKTFLYQKGVATSRTTSYNPAGNGQVERLNNTLWKTIMLILGSRKLPITYWRFVLDDALHSIRSLLCTATNCTPHERLFNYQRRSTNGTAVPTWLLTPGLVLLKRHNRSNIRRAGARSRID